MRMVDVRCATGARTARAAGNVVDVVDVVDGVAAVVVVPRRVMMARHAHVRGGRVAAGEGERSAEEHAAEEDPGKEVFFGVHVRGVECGEAPTKSGPLGH